MSEQEFSEFAEPDQQLLQELGESLQQSADLQLPPDFAKATAQLAKQRRQQLPAWKKGFLKAESWLNSSVTSPGSRLGAAFLLLTSVGLAAASPKFLGPFALLLGLLGGLTKLMSHWMAIPDVAQSWKVSRLSVAYYLTPLLASATTSVAFGSLVGFLSTRNFAAEETVMSFAALSGLAFFVYLQSALMPLWSALLDRSQGNLPILLLTQLGFAGWFVLPLQIWASIDSNFKSEHVWALALTPALLTVALLARKPRREVMSGLGSSLWDCMGSLLMGGIPIFGLLFGFYQLNLTRHLEDPKAYEQLRQYYEEWTAKQQAIPPEQNGWMHLKAFMLKNPTQPNQAIADRLRKGSHIYEYHLSKNALSEKDYQQARREFLQELPRIEMAMASPEFSWVTPETLKPRVLVPNFLVARFVSQGLSSLAQEEMDQGNNEQALRYILLNLKWSSAFRRGNLIHLMVATAQLHFACEPIERWLLTTSPSDAQLRTLAEALDRHRLEPESFQIAMKHEAYLGDQLLKELVQKNKSVNLGEEIGFGFNQGLLFQLIPRSFWESERKLYLNQFLGQLTQWRELGRPEDMELSDNLRYSVVALMFPSSSRGQIVFTVRLTQMEALRTQVALEQFRLEKGHYPKELTELMPKFLDHLPVDAINPNVWAHKPHLQYSTTRQGYELVSTSPLYKRVRSKSRQVFGHDGRWEQEPRESK